jgi:DNA-binding transcriptional ArsR family regulator
MKEGTVTVQASTVREFLHIITAQAKAALAGIERPGLLQMSRLHPGSELLVPSRFVTDDLEHMIQAAIVDSEAGHNVYLEGRTVREDLRGNGRGKLTDTVAVFALTVDSDADKQMSWTPTARVSMTVETSPGNFQFWFFLREAIEPELAQKLGERIRRAVRSDHDTGNPVQPYRVAGTINYPSPKKIARGRTIAPTRLIEFDPEALWSPEEIEAAFPLPEQPKGNGGAAAGQADEADVPDDTMRVIRDGPKHNNDRSDVFWNVVVALKRLGWTADGILGLLERYPNGVAKKYEGRLRQEVDRAYNKIKTKAAPGKDAKQQEPIVMAIAEDVTTMSFPPLKYVVPDVFIEGLTLLAGKPKIGKSWLLLHAAVAVARGGFTLGDRHCIEGDVLYCALEDSQRRMKARLIKLLGSNLTGLKRLTICSQMPRLSVGGLDAIRNWIASHPEARLILIDTLAMVREPRKREDTSYDADYQAVLELRQLANEFNLAIVVVHHLRKAEADDAFDTVSGTLGLTGAPDSILILKRDATGNFVLHGKGRDLIEIEKAMTFDRESCVWRMGDDAAVARRSAERNAVLEALADATEPMGPNDIAAAAGMRPVNVRNLLPKLIKEGLIEKVERGRYRRKV